MNHDHMDDRWQELIEPARGHGARTRGAADEDQRRRWFARRGLADAPFNSPGRSRSTPAGPASRMRAAGTAISPPRSRTSDRRPARVVRARRLLAAPEPVADPEAVVRRPVCALGEEDEGLRPAHVATLFPRRASGGPGSTRARCPESSPTQREEDIDATTPAPLPPRPWEELPPDIAGTLRPGLGPLVEEMIAAISEEVPAYRRPLEGEFGAGLRRGVAEALEQFLDLIENGGELTQRDLRIYVDFGRWEAGEGRRLESLLAAYRLGARLSWRRIAETIRGEELGEETVALLAESVFAHIDELSAASAEGFAAELADRAGERDRLRRRLIRMLVDSPGADPAAVREAAAALGWEPAAELAALVYRAGSPDRVAAHLPDGTLVGDDRRDRDRADPRSARPGAPGRGRAGAARPRGRPRHAGCRSSRSIAASSGPARSSASARRGRSPPTACWPRTSISPPWSRWPTPTLHRRPRGPPARSAGRPDAGRARAARVHPARVARPPGRRPRRRGGAARPSADGPLPGRPAARAARRRPRGPLEPATSFCRARLRRSPARRAGPRPRRTSSSAGSVSLTKRASSRAKGIGCTRCGKWPAPSKSSKRLPGISRAARRAVLGGDDPVALAPDDQRRAPTRPGRAGPAR